MASTAAGRKQLLPFMGFPFTKMRSIAEIEFDGCIRKARPGMLMNARYLGYNVTVSGAKTGH
jgi:hypothetical protein